MATFRNGRFLFWFIRELSQKYAASLVLGLILGLAVTVGAWRLYPILAVRWFMPTQKIGIIGSFTPTTFPLSIQRLISLGLTDLSADGQATPSLASSWEVSPDGKIYLFHLRSDMHWHNGKPVTASDVNYNIRNVNFTVLDPHTLKVTLLSPYSPLPTLLAKPIFSAGLGGFGPYRVSQIQLKGDKVAYLKLVPVTEPGLAAREYRFYPTETTAVVAYKIGEIDTLEDLSSPNELNRWGKSRMTQATNFNRIVSLFFNTRSDLLKDKTLRQALGYALPHLDGKRALSPISIDSWAYTDKVRSYDTDLANAQKLLESTKVSSSSATLTITTFVQYVDVAQLIANNWTTLGIPTNVKVENTIPSDYEVLLSAQDIPPDPDQYPFWHSTQSQTNITGYANVKIDKLLEDGRQELNLDNRKKIYADFQRRLVDDAPALFLYYPTYYSVSR